MVYLWVEKDVYKGMCMNMNNTNKGYEISTSNNQKIKQILIDEK